MELAIVEDGQVQAVLTLPEGSSPDGSGYGVGRGNHIEIDISGVESKPCVGWEHDGSEFHAPERISTVSRESGLTIEIKGEQPMPPTCFPTGSTALNQIQAVAVIIALTGKLPGDKNQFPMRDVDGIPHDLTLDQYRGVAAALLEYSVLSSIGVSTQDGVVIET